MAGRTNNECLNMDCLMKVLEKANLETLVLDVPLVCKSWHEASLNPDCQRVLEFPKFFSRMRMVQSKLFPIYDFGGRSIKRYGVMEILYYDGFIKLVVKRSQRSALKVVRPNLYTKESLEYVVEGCPTLKVLALPTIPLDQIWANLPKIIGKWKDLVHLGLGTINSSFKDNLSQINEHCPNFSGLLARGFIGKEKASAIVTFFPKIKYMKLRWSIIDKEFVKKILEGCKELELLDLRDCFGFDADKEIMKMASHINKFMHVGSHSYIKKGTICFPLNYIEVDGEDDDGPLYYKDVYGAPF